MFFKLFKISEQQERNRPLVFFLALSLLVSPMFMWATAASAMSAAQTVRLLANQNAQVTVYFTNTTGKTLTSGLNKASVYVYGKSSVLGHASWLGNDHPAIMNQATLAPGAMGSATFWVHAPTKAGTYWLLSVTSTFSIRGSTP